MKEALIFMGFLFILIGAYILFIGVTSNDIFLISFGSFIILFPSWKIWRERNWLFRDSMPFGKE